MKIEDIMADQESTSTSSRHNSGLATLSSHLEMEYAYSLKIFLLNLSQYDNKCFVHF